MGALAQGTLLGAAVQTTQAQASEGKSAPAPRGSSGLFGSGNGATLGIFAAAICAVVLAAGLAFWCAVSPFGHSAIHIAHAHGTEPSCA